MTGPLALRNILWLGTTATEIVLLVFLLRENYRILTSPLSSTSLRQSYKAPWPLAFTTSWAAVR
jgi:hypothetical protein